MSTAELSNVRLPLGRDLCPLGVVYGRSLAILQDMATLTEHHPSFLKLLTFLARIPVVRTDNTPSGGFVSSMDEGGWWVRLSLDIDHHLAWSAVREMGYLLNVRCIPERLPTVFMPVSLASYLERGPPNSIFWVIECRDKKMKPGTVADLLEGRLPQPVEDISAWPDD